jgi:hypothetical protein
MNFNKCSQLTYGVHFVNATSILNGIVGPTISISFTIVPGSGSSPVVTPPVLLPNVAPLAVPVPSSVVPSTTPPAIPAPVANPILFPIPMPVFVPTVAVPYQVPITPTVPTSAQVPIPSTVPAPIPFPFTAPVLDPSQTFTPQGTVSAIHTLRLMYTGVNPSVPLLDLAFDKVNVLDLQLLNLPSGKFNIDALVGPGVKSVSFSNGRIETSAPLAYCGNFGLTFYDCENLVDGANVTVTVTAYPETGGQGNPILTRSTILQLIRPLPPIAPTPPTIAPVAAPIIPPVPGCPVPRVSYSFRNRYLVPYNKFIR